MVPTEVRDIFRRDFDKIFFEICDISYTSVSTEDLKISDRNIQLNA